MRKKEVKACTSIEIYAQTETAGYMWKILNSEADTLLNSVHTSQLSCSAQCKTNVALFTLFQLHLCI